MAVSFVPMAAVDERLGEIAVREERPFGIVSKGYSSFETGDVLFAKITPCMENGKAALVGDLSNGIGRGSTEFYVLRPGERVLSEYIFYIVRQPRFRAEAKSNFTGTAGQQRVPKSFIENTLIPLPPLAEQRRLVDILNRAAKISRLRARAEERLREFIPALFVGMFGDPAAKSSRPSQKTFRLGDIAAIIPGQSPPGKTYNDSGEGLPFFQGKADFGNFHPIARKWCVAPKKIAEPGDILISVRAPVGPTNLADRRCCIGRGLTAIRPDESVALRDFLYWSLKHLEPNIAGMATGTTFVAITRRDLESVMFPLPPLARQREFSELVEKARAAFTLSEAGGAAATELSAALMSRLLGDAA